MSPLGLQPQPPLGVQEVEGHLQDLGEGGGQVTMQQQQVGTLHNGPLIGLSFSTCKWSQLSSYG
jgi:hypothetical protein